MFESRLPKLIHGRLELKVAGTRRRNVSAAADEVNYKLATDYASARRSCIAIPWDFPVTGKGLAGRIWQGPILRAVRERLAGTDLRAVWRVVGG